MVLDEQPLVPQAHNRLNQSPDCTVHDETELHAGENSDQHESFDLGVWQRKKCLQLSEQIDQAKSEPNCRRDDCEVESHAKAAPVVPPANELPNLFNVFRIGELPSLKELQQRECSGTSRLVWSTHRNPPTRMVLV
jgi:hypothetical protein